MTDTNTSRKILASGDGKGHPSLFGYWSFFAFIFLVCTGFVPGLWAHGMLTDAAAIVQQANQAGITAEEREILKQTVGTLRQRGNILAAVAVLGFIAFVVLGMTYHRAITGSFIRVYENEIEGKSVGANDFQLTYKQITGIDSNKTEVKIFASGTYYVCPVANPAEIHKVIAEQLQKAESAT